MKKAVALLVVAVGLLGLSACGSAPTYQVKALFSDVGDLAPAAPVMMDDVKVGEVKGITLDHDRALVSMAIDQKADVPRDVIARVRRTSLLGERIVDLVIVGKGTGPRLTDGATIARTESRPDLEDLVSAGNAVLQPITASEIATLVDEGYKGFANHGADLRTLLQNFNSIAQAYSQKTDEITSVITSLNQFNTTIAQQAPAQGLSVQNSAHALDVLNEESARLQAAVHELVRLSIGAKGILDAHTDEMTHFFAQMRTILGVLQQQETDLEGFLRWAPHHDYNTQVVEYEQFNQVFQDFVICGFNEDPNDPARTCNPGNSNKTGHG